MTARELAHRLQELGIRVSARGESLRVSAPRGAVTPELRAALTAHRSELLRFFRKVADGEPRGQAGTRQLVTLQREGDRAPLFVVHPVGGDLFCYFPLVRHLGTERPVLGFRTPGLDEGPALAEIETMARELVAELPGGRDPEAGILLAGWSMGGVVAFEMARQLEAAGKRIAFVGLLDSYPPAPRSRTLADVLGLFSRHLGQTFDHREFDLEPLLDSPADEAVESFLARLDASGLSAREDFGICRSRRRFEVFWSNLTAFDRYRVKPSVRSLTLFRAAGRSDGKERAAPWLEVTGRLQVEEVPGGHFSMLQEPHVARLAECLRTALSRAEASPRPSSP